MDDAFCYLYQNNYQNAGRKNRPHYGQVSFSKKFFEGFCFAFGLIMLILAPIIIFSGFSTILVDNPVIYATLNVQFELNNNGNSYSLLTTQAFDMTSLTKENVESLETLFIESNTKYDHKKM